jgi:hypothetical protein
MAETVTPTDEALLDEVQRAAFDYFLQTVNPANGLVADTSRENSPVSIAVVGFALSSYPVAVERGPPHHGRLLAAAQRTGLAAAGRFLRLAWPSWQHCRDRTMRIRRSCPPRVQGHVPGSTHPVSPPVSALSVLPRVVMCK